MGTTWTTKDPAEVQSYTFNWIGIVGNNDYITASTWAITVPSSGSTLTISSNSFTDTTTTVKVAGGTSGTAYSLTNTITTSKGLTLIQIGNLTVTTKT